MKILFLTDSFPPEIKSASHLYYELAVSLVGKGHKVTVVTGFPRNYLGEAENKRKKRLFSREAAEGVEVVRVSLWHMPRKIIFMRGMEHFFLIIPFFIAGLFLKKHDAMLVYSPPLTMGVAAFLIKFFKGTPFVLNIQDIYPQTPIDLGLLKNKILIRIAEKMENFVYKKSSLMTVYSPANAKYLVKKGVDGKKTAIIANWVDTDMIKPSGKMNGFRKKFGLGEDFIVSFAGTMGFAQGLETVVMSAKLLENEPRIKFVLVGDGVKKEELQNQAKSLGLSNVIFLPMQPRQDYPQILAASDVCLVTLDASLKTPTIPGKIMSIMAAGRPIVAGVFPDGDAAALIRDAKAGIAVKADDAKALSGAILKIYHDGDLGEKFGGNARIYAEKFLSRKSSADKYERLFLNIATRIIK